jgi:hypothetical protein
MNLNYQLTRGYAALALIVLLAAAAWMQSGHNPSRSVDVTSRVRFSVAFVPGQAEIPGTCNGSAPAASVVPLAVVARHAGRAGIAAITL